MSYAHVQSKLGSVTGTSLTITFTSNVVTDDRIIALLATGSSDASAHSVTDNAGGGSNSYTNDSDFNDNVNVRSTMASANVTRGGGSALQVILAIGGASRPLWGWIAEYSGLSTATGASAVDTTGTNSRNGAGTTLSVTGSPNPSAYNLAAIAHFDDFAANAYTATSGTIRLQGAEGNGQVAIIDLPSIPGTTTASADVAANGNADHENMVVYKLAVGEPVAEMVVFY